MKEAQSTEETSSVGERLARVKAEIRKASREAFQRSHLHLDIYSSAATGQQLDADASFRLGMELFGSDVSVIEQNVQHRLTEIEQELEIVLSDLADDDNLQPTDDPHRTPEELEEVSGNLRLRVRFLRECSRARSLLDESIKLFSPALAPNGEPDLARSAALLVEAQQALNEAQDVVSGQRQKSGPSSALDAAFQMADSIRAAIRRHKIATVTWATSVWQSSVALTPNTLSVRSSLDLAVAYDVLEVLAQDKNSSLEDILRKFTRTLYQEVFQPVLNSHRVGRPKTSWSFRETQDRPENTALAAVTTSTKRRSVHGLEWTCENEDFLASTEPKSGSPQIAAWKDTTDFLQRILVFVADHVLLQRVPLCTFVGKRFFGEPNAAPNVLNLAALGLESRRIGDDNGLLLEPMVDILDEVYIPRYLMASEASVLDAISAELATIVDSFLHTVKSKNFLQAGDETRLASYAPSLKKRYVEKRRCDILNEARDVLLHMDYYNTMEVGVDVHLNKDEEKLGLNDGLAVFKLEKSSVSCVSLKLMELCRRTMDEAAEQRPSGTEAAVPLLSETLYRTAREILDLYRAIVPVKYGLEIANVPRTAAILHNDCVFLGHHCLTLGLEYRDKLVPEDRTDAQGNLLRQFCIFVDMVPLFRELADRSMGKMLDLQGRQIVELVLDRISALGGSLRSNQIVAEWSEAETALAAAVYHLRHLSQSWKPVLSYDIHNRSLCYLADVLFSLFVDQILKARDISTIACQFIGGQFEKATQDIADLIDGDKSGSRMWDRFAALGKFMNMSLAEVQTALADGVFYSVTGPELSRLVAACFGDTPKRRNLLKLLSAS